MAVPFYMAGMEICMNKKKKKFVSYAKWGYIFLIPFFAVYIVFSLIPLISTFYNSFFENYMVGLMQVGPKFVGFDNYKAILFNGDTLLYLKNTMIMWLMGFIPNLIMASAFAMLFYAIFADQGPINNMLNSMGLPTYRFLAEVAGARGLIALMNFLMWFGNTTIILMAAIMGVDPCLFEAARIDGANSRQIFGKITLPLIKPILAYTLITSLIGGIQMFDVPQILTNGNGNPDRTSMTVIMYLNKHLYSKNYGMAGALSVILFIVTAVLSIFVFNYITKDMEAAGIRKAKKKKAKEAK